MIEYEGGMRRDNVKPMYRKIPFRPLRRLALALTEGSIKYDEGIYDRNWKKASPQAAAECVDHMVEHLWKWLEGEKDEDHFGHFLANAFFLGEYEETGVFDPAAGIAALLAAAEEAEPEPEPEEVSKVAKLKALLGIKV